VAKRHGGKGFGLLAASFLSATVLPGGSEALLWGFCTCIRRKLGRR
jgi:membrane protein YqaA with SNARE-associated domain